MTKSIPFFFGKNTKQALPFQNKKKRVTFLFGLICCFVRMEDVPLDDFKPKTPSSDVHAKEYNPQEELDQLARYKSSMGTAIEILRLYLSSLQGWTVIDSSTAANIVLYEKHLANDNSFLLQVKGIVNGRASRYFHVIRDHEQDTRLPWDKENITMCKEHETYKADEGDIVVVESVWRSRHPRLFSDRRAFGILSSVYNAEQETYSLYFCSETHLRFGSASNSVDTQVLLGIVLRKIDKHQTEISIVLRVDPKVSNFSVMSIMFANEYKEELRKRVQLYERVVQQWDLFYGPKRDPKKLENRR